MITSVPSDILVPLVCVQAYRGTGTNGRGLGDGKTPKDHGLPFCIRMYTIHIYIYISFIIIPCFAPHELAVLVPFCPTGERLGGDVDVRRGGRTVRQAEPHQRSPTQADRSVGGAEASSFGAERGEGQFTG